MASLACSTSAGKAASPAGTTRLNGRKKSSFSPSAARSKVRTFAGKEESVTATLELTADNVETVLDEVRTAKSSPSVSPVSSNSPRHFAHFVSPFNKSPVFFLSTSSCLFFHSIFSQSNPSRRRVVLPKHFCGGIVSHASVSHGPSVPRRKRFERPRDETLTD